jgi:hypothetical protein
MMQRISKAAYSINRNLVYTVKYNKQEQLFLHQINKDLIKVSFSENPEKLHLGTLNPEVIQGLDLRFAEITVNNFKENKEFIPVLHKTFFNHVYDDQGYIIDALNYPGSYMAISDYKVILDYMDQRPEMQNTLGFVHVNPSGIMERGSYQKNDTYTLCNIDGVIKLSENMANQLENYL